jgi:DNA-binding FrmR family transcriptional regulator
MEELQQQLDPFRESVIVRLKTVKGHISGIEKMIAARKPCEEILVQIAAVRASINKVGLMIVEDNALNCLAGVEDGQPVDSKRFEDAVKIIIDYLK